MGGARGGGKSGPYRVIRTAWVDMGLEAEVTEREEVVKPRPKRRRGNKYGAKRTVYDGRAFDSKFEAAVARALCEGGYGIALLKMQVPFTFACGAVYRADFVACYEDGRRVVIEAKGKETDVWRLKEKMFRHEYPDIHLLVVKKLSDLEALRDQA